MTPEFPSVGTKRADDDDATAGNTLLFHPERFPLRTADWLHGNAPTNHSSAANWPYGIMIRPIIVSESLLLEGGEGGGRRR